MQKSTQQSQLQSDAVPCSLWRFLAREHRVVGHALKQLVVDHGIQPQAGLSRSNQARWPVVPSDATRPIRYQGCDGGPLGLPRLGISERITVLESLSIISS